MRRRFVLAGAAAFAASRAAGQSGEPPLVAFIGFASEVSDRAGVEALRAGFAENGQVVGRTVRIESRHAEGDLDRVPAMVRDFMNRNAVVFIVPGQAAARMLVRLTKTPIVAVGLPPTVSDTELFHSLARPGGTVTGFSNFAEELAAKRIELLREAIPDMRAIGILHNMTDPVFRGWGVETEAAARAQGLEPLRLGISSVAPGEVTRLIGTLKPAGASGLIVIRDFLTHSVRDEIFAAAIAEGIATVTEDRDSAAAGAFMSYGADMRDQFRRAAGYAMRIVRGEKPGELPIQLATKLELVLNMKTAHALGTDVPPSILLRADEVIE